jgi:hypothetical protein
MGRESDVMKKIVLSVPVIFAMWLAVANAQSPMPPDRPTIPVTGVHPRLRIVNQCTSDIWAIFTPGGNPSQIAALQNSGGWLRAYADQEHFAGTGATADATATDTVMVTVSEPPDDHTLYFHPGQFIEIVTTGNIQNDTPGPTAMISAVSSNPVEEGTILTLDQKVKVPPDPGNIGTNGKAQIFVDLLQGALLIKAGDDNTFQIPDGGAPSGRFTFFTGCPVNGIGKTDPFGPHSCTIGAANTALAATNTVAEVSFGCTYSSQPDEPAKNQNCAFNASSPADVFPNCAANPNATNCGPLGTNDFYDVSAVDGYTFPLKVDVTAQAPLTDKICNNNSGNFPLTATEASIDGSMLDLFSCPAENKMSIYSTNQDQQDLINGEGGVSLLTKWNANDAPDPVSGAVKACVAPYQWFGDQTKTLGDPVDKAPQNADCASGTCTSTSYYAAKSCDGTNTTTKRFFCPEHSGPQQRVGPHLVVPFEGYETPDGMFSIHNTNYVKQLYALGYKGYTWQFDDGVGLLNCPSTYRIGDPAEYTSYTITACPSGATTNPAEPAKWVYSSTTGTCVASSVGGGVTSYGSIIACQRANIRYVCDNVTGFDPFKVPNALWRADPDATKAKTGFTWTQVASYIANTKPSCGMHEYPAGITPDFKDTPVSLPLCTYYYGGGSQLCPSAGRGARLGERRSQ